MAEKKEKPVKPKSGKGKQLKPSAIAVIDNMVFSQTDTWAYYRLSTNVYDFLSNDGKIGSAYQIANAFTNLVGDRRESLDVHLIVTSVPVDVDAWAVQVKETSKDWERSPGFERYVQSQIEMLKTQEYLKKVVLLGVNLGKRGALEFENVNFLELGFKSAKEQLSRWWSNALSIPSNEISAEEEDNARRKEAEIFRTLSNGNLRGKRMSAEDLLLTLKRQFYPAMPAPYLEVDHENRLGPGDMDLELISGVENKYRWLKITQMVGGTELSGYRACLSFSKFPRVTGYPGGWPFLYFPAKLSLPFTLYARLTLVPSEGMKKQLEKKRKEMVDELENVNNSGQTSGASGTLSGGQPSAISEAIGDMQTMTELLQGDKTPWVTGSYRIVVETPTEEILKKYCSIVKQSYSDLDINVSWTAGDQAELFLEQMPGDKLRSKPFNQVTNMAFLATSGFRNSSDVGDLIFGSGEGE